MAKLHQALADALYETQEWLSNIDSEVELHLDRDIAKDWWNLSATCSLCRKHERDFCGFAGFYFVEAAYVNPKENIARSLKAAMGECVDGCCVPAETAAEVLAGASLHITMAGCHCGDAACTRCDPMGRMVDGLSVRECLEWHESHQRNDLGFLGSSFLTPAQKDAARTAWSAELKRKVEEGKARERTEVVCDDDRWEP